jgi:hypothetical protein
MCAIGFRGVLGLTILALGVAARAQARDGDVPDKARRAEAIAAQKVEGEIRDALLEAQRRIAGDRAKAVAILKKALALLDDDTALPEGRRTSLRSMLKDRIRVAETDPGRDADGARDDDRRAAAERKAAEQAAIDSQIQAIRDLQREGKVSEANRLAHQLARKYPGNPTVFALLRATSSAEQVADQRTSKQDKERRVTDVTRDVSRAGVGPKDDIEFPEAKKWRALTERRVKTVAQLKPKEKALLDALDAPLTVEFRQTRFDDAIEYMQTIMGLPLVVDTAGLADAGVGMDSPVNLRLKGANTRTVLRTMLSHMGLYFVVKEEVIMVTSVQRAKDMMITRTYPIGDILVTDAESGGRLAMLRNAWILINIITSSIDPPSWQVNGGKGTIVFLLDSMSLVVHQSAEIHSQLSGLAR